MIKITPSEFYRALEKNNIAYTTLKPEQKICVEFTNYLKEKTLKGNFPFIWFHVPNEYFRGKVKAGGYFGAIQTAMGRISGVADYCFISRHKSFFIEFKTKSGKLSSSQQFFEKWCLEKDIHYAICRSSKEGIELVEKMIQLA
jgi:hypothetical protein